MHAKFSCVPVMMFLIHRNVVHAQCMWHGRQSNVQYKKKLAHFVSPGKIVAMPWLPFSSEYELGEYENV